MRSPSHRFRRIFRAKSEAKAKSENRPRCRAKSESRPRWKNPDLGAAQARQAGNCRIRRQFRIFFWEESRPWAWQGSDAGQARPGGYARQECGALGVGQARIRRAIRRGWGEPSNKVGNEVGRASTIGRARTHWANPYWASHQTRLGRAIKRGWASQYSLGEPVPVPARHV